MAFNSDVAAAGYVATAVVDAAVRDIKALLKERIMREVEPEIDGIVEQAVAEMNIRANAARNPMDMQMVVNLIQGSKGPSA